LDVPEARAAAETVRTSLAGEGYPVFAISAVTGEGVPMLLRAVWEALQAARAAAPAPAAADFKVFHPTPRDDFRVAREDGVFVVRGRTPERVVAMTDLDSEEGVADLQRRLARLGVTAAREKAVFQIVSSARFRSV